MYPIKAPANASPAPVGSITSSSGYAGTAKSEFWLNCRTPYSPRFTSTVSGPILRIARPALTRLCSPLSIRASSSLTVRISSRGNSLIKSWRSLAIQWFIVSAMPAKGRTLATHQSTHVDIALREQPHMIGLEVGTDHRDDTHRRKKSRRQSKEARRTAERVSDAAVLRLDRVVPNRTDYDDTHLILIPAFLSRPVSASCSASKPHDAIHEIGLIAYLVSN